MNTFKESEAIKSIFSTFRGITGAKVKIGRSPKPTIDASADISLGTQTHSFWVEVKNEIRQTQLPGIIQQFGNQKEKWILIARYIPNPQKAALKDASINYLEASGNCYINVDSIYIYIDGREVTTSRQTDNSKLWSPTGLKFLSVIITAPDLLIAPYRLIARTAGIALGSIGPLFEELRTNGFLNAEFPSKLHNRDKLLQHWSELYHLTLRPKLIRGRFRFLKETQRENWKKLSNKEFSWGGEPAADLLTNHLEPRTYTIYTTKTDLDLIRLLHLVPAADGDIEILNQYWDSTILNNNPDIPDTVALPLIVYAELLAGNDSRTWETADLVKKRYLHERNK